MAVLEDVAMVTMKIRFLLVQISALVNSYYGVWLLPARFVGLPEKPQMSPAVPTPARLPNRALSATQKGDPEDLFTPYE